MSENKSFKTKTSFEARRNECLRVREKYPSRVPIIIEKNPGSSLPNIDKSKYLVPQDQTIGQIITVIRKRIEIKHNEAIFVFINNVLPCMSESIINVYNKNKDNDGFLYITYSGENTFGEKN